METPLPRCPAAAAALQRADTSVPAPRQRISLCMQICVTGGGAAAVAPRTCETARGWGQNTATRNNNSSKGEWGASRSSDMQWRPVLLEVLAPKAIDAPLQWSACRSARHRPQKGTAAAPENGVGLQEPERSGGAVGSGRPCSASLPLINRSCNPDVLDIRYRT